MCGIVGYVGYREASPILVQGLRRLEYRGYDSAGIATLVNGRIEVRRCVGKLASLERLLREQPLSGTLGIGHTRWATHGRPSDENAHPHRAGQVVVIHNGIIENYLELRQELTARGNTFASETDTEVICHLIDQSLRDDHLGFAQATRSALRRLRGSFAIVALCEAEPGKLVAAKSATPIVIGQGEGENFVASDIPALLDSTRRMIFLDDGEIAEVSSTAVSITTFAGEPVERRPKEITWDPITAQKGGYKHFLLKEIHDQPQALLDTVRGRILPGQDGAVLPEIDDELIASIKRVTLVACGTAWHACLVGKFFLEEMARLPTEVDYASEFRYRLTPIDGGTLVLAVSQSGETADTLAALEGAKAAGARTLAVCNVVDSSISRKADGVIYTHAGPEISVASTKAFTTQLITLFLLALHMGRRRECLPQQRARELVAAAIKIPGLIGDVLARSKAIEKIAKKYGHATDFLYLGRGINYPIALEGALKLKEISYIHAEGYPAGEMKHGPIALIDESMPVVVLLPRDRVYDKTLSNMKEVEARSGRIIAVTDEPSPELEEIAWEIIQVPRTDPLLLPILLCIPLQLLAYHVAVYRGTDVDQPRNLAKSVTVE